MNSCRQSVGALFHLTPLLAAALTNNLQVVSLTSPRLTSYNAQAQQPVCGISAITESVAPVYAAIARASQVEGTVVLLVDFGLNGAPDYLTVVSGPEFLRANARTFVLGWRANSSSVVRHCQVKVDYRLQREGDKQVPLFQRLNLLHVIVNSGIPITQPSPGLIRQ